MKKIFYTPLVAILLLSCEKGLDLNLDFSNINWGGPYNFNTNNFDSIGLSYMQLPVARYYIYKDEASGNTDSVRVTKSNLTWNYRNAAGTSPALYHYTYDLTLTSFSAAPGQVWYQGRAACDSDYKNVNTYVDASFDLSNEISKLPAYWYPFVSSGSNQYSKIPFLPIEGTLYGDVHRFAATNGLPHSDPAYQASIFYWAKGVGIIKKEIISSQSLQTFLLLRYGN